MSKKLLFFFLVTALISPFRLLDAEQAGQTQHIVCDSSQSELRGDSAIAGCVDQPDQLFSPERIETELNKVSPSNKPEEEKTSPQSPSKTPIPTPDSYPNVAGPRSSFFAFRLNDKLQIERKGNEERFWRVADPTDTLGISQVRLRAFAAIKSNSPNLALSSTVTYTIGKNVPADMLLSYKHLIDMSFAYWGQHLKSKEIPVLIFTEKDRDLLNSYWMQRWNGVSTIARYERELEKYDDLSTQLFRSVGGAAGGQQIRETNDQETNQLVGMDLYMGSLHSQETSLLIDHVPHEFAHVFQFSMIEGVRPSIVTGDWNNPDSLVESNILVPCSLFEGSAVTFGAGIPVDSARWYSDGMDVIMRRFQSSNPNYVLTSPEDVVQSLITARSWLPNNRESGFPLGALAYEYFLAEYGFGAYLDLFRAIPSAGSFDGALMSVIGVSELDFYRQAAPHILAEWQRASS